FWATEAALKTAINRPFTTNRTTAGQARARRFSKLNLEAVPELRREQILRLQQPVECALLVAIGEEGLDRLAIAFDAVGEGVGAEQLRVVVCVVEAPGNREARGRHLGRAVEAAALGFLEALEQRHGDPGRPLV